MFFFWGGSYSVVLNGYSWFCIQYLCLVVLGGPYEMLWQLHARKYLTCYTISSTPGIFFVIVVWFMGTLDSSQELFLVLKFTLGELREPHRLQGIKRDSHMQGKCLTNCTIILLFCQSKNFAVSGTQLICRAHTSSKTHPYRKF